MRTTVTLVDDLLAEAMKLTGIEDRGSVLHAGSKALVERESARRLARLGGSQPTIPGIRRRRSAR
jgi:Arc/MetJ family transcription regulator